MGFSLRVKKELHKEGHCHHYWRTAHSKTLSYSLNRKLEQLGLMNMSKTLQSIQCD